MSAAASRPLTERQRAVMERIDRRVPIKVIAQELGVSETRVNQHIRALKNIFQAGSLGDLVERYRESAGYVAQEGAQLTYGANPTGEAFSEPEYSKKQVLADGVNGDEPVRVDPGELVMSDVLPLVQQAPWLRVGEPQIVPRVLDGQHAVLARLAAIMVIAFGFLAAVVLTVTAALTISDALDGRASIPVDEQGLT